MIEITYRVECFRFKRVCAKRRDALDAQTLSRHNVNYDQKVRYFVQLCHAPEHPSNDISRSKILHLYNPHE